MNKTLQKIIDFSKMKDGEEILRLLESPETTGNAGDLVVEHYKSKQYKGFLGENKIESIEAFKKYAERNSLETAEILSRADNFVRGNFVFREPWDMERTIDGLQFEGEIDWECNPKGDPEWTWMVNRHSYFPGLAQAYVITGDEKYKECFEDHIRSWIATQKYVVSKENTSWRTIDSGIRLRNWAKALEMFLAVTTIDGELFLQIIESIVEHFEYSAQKAGLERAQSNWVILEHNGVQIMTIYFDEIVTSIATREVGIKLLEEALDLQIHPDGMHWEQSFQYHNEVLFGYLEIMLICQRNGIVLSEAFVATCQKMATMSIYSMRPDKKQLAYGDSDNEDMQLILTLAYAIMKEEILAHGCYSEITNDVLSLLGSEYLDIHQRIQEIQKHKASLQSKAFEHSGLFFLKDDGADTNTHIMFKCGPLGGGHGHDDVLHFDIFTQGSPILIDSGRYTYEFLATQRSYFKDCTAHNTIKIDGRNFNEHSSSWVTDKVATPLPTKHAFSQQIDFVQGGHLGYFGLEDAVIVQRKLIYIKPGILVITDEFTCKGEHIVEQYFNFEKDSVRLKNRQQAIFEDENTCLEITALHTSGYFEVQPNEISHSYNEKKLSHRLVGKTTITGTTTLVSVIQFGATERTSEIIQVPVLNEAHRILDDATVTGLKIIGAGKPSYLVVNHREDIDSRRSYVIDGIRVYGLVVYVDESGKRHVIV